MNYSIRANLVKETLSKIRAIADDREMDYIALNEILNHLKHIASHSELWGSDDFPDPELNQLHNRYLISEDGDNRYALYLNVMRSGKHISPHNHTTWAAIAAIQGVEYNHIYTWTNELDGRKSLKLAESIPVGPGNGIVLLPEDIHSVEIKDGGIIRHLHIYGKSLEKLNKRLTFDITTQTSKTMSIGAVTIKDYRIDNN